MGMVVEFPAETAQRRARTVAAASAERMGTVVILPAIRIERHIDHHDDDLFNGGGAEQGAPSGGGRKRRARS